MQIGQDELKGIKLQVVPAVPTIDTHLGPVLDTRGKGTRYHGSSSVISALNPDAYNSRNIYGSGFYTTDAADIAVGYTKKGGGASPTLYHVAPKSDLKVLNLESKMDEEFVKTITPDESSVLTSDELTSAALEEVGPSGTYREFMDALRGNSSHYGMTTDDVQETFDSMQRYFSDLGYRAWRHEGGHNTKSKAHDVVIYFRPEEDLTITPIKTEDLRSKSPVGIGGGSSAGAAANPAEFNPLLPTAPIIDGEIPSARFGKVRMDSVGQLGSIAESKSARLYAQHLGEESVGMTDRSTVSISASERGSRLHRSAQVQWYQAVKPSWEKWAKDQGINWFQRRNPGSAYRRFMSEVADYVENADPLATAPHPSVAQVGERFRKIMASYADLAANPGADEGTTRRAIEGFTNLTRDQFYLPKYSDPDKINSLFLRFAPRTLHNFVKQAVLDAVDDIEDELADRIAAGYLKRIRGAGYGIQENFDSAFRSSNPDTIRTALEDIGVAGEHIDQIVARVAKRDTSDSARAKHRTPLNYTYSARVQAKDGSVQPLSMKDFFVNDADELINRYSREMSGRVALAKVRIRNPDDNKIIVDGITSEADFAKMMDHVKQDFAVSPTSGTDGKLKMAVENMEFLHRAILGQPHHNGDTHVAWLRRLRDFNVLRLMNRMGINQAQEVGIMISQLGLRAMLKQMPALRRITDGIGDKVLNNRLARELEAGLGLGTDQFFGAQRFRQLDDIAGEKLGQGRTASMGRRIDNALVTGKHITSNISFMTSVNSRLQQWAARSIAQGFADDAFGKGMKALKGSKLDRLKSLGMDEKTAEKVYAQIRQHAEVKGSRTLTALNMEKWEPAIRSKFLDTVYRHARKVVMENDAGNLHRWMSKPGMQVMFQFRTFIFGAWAKRTLSNLHHLDMTAATTLFAEIMLGAATHALNVSVNASTRPDGDEYLEKELTPLNLAKKGFGRSGIGSIIPTVVDSAAAFTPLGPQFDARTSATPNDLLFGVPAIDWLTSSSTFTKGLMESTWEGREMSQKEIMAGPRSMPFGNWWPIMTLMGEMYGDRSFQAPR